MAATVMAPVTNTLPADERPEVRTLYKFAKEIAIYNFKPEIIVCQTNQKFREMEVATPTHSAEIARSFVFSLHSHYDSSDTRGDTNAIKEWYKAALARFVAASTTMGMSAVPVMLKPNHY